MTIDAYGHLMDGDDEKTAQTTQEIYGKVGKKKGSKKVAGKLTFAWSQFQPQIRTRSK